MIEYGNEIYPDSWEILGWSFKKKKEGKLEYLEVFEIETGLMAREIRKNNENWVHVEDRLSRRFDIICWAEPAYKKSLKTLSFFKKLKFTFWLFFGWN